MSDEVPGLTMTREERAYARDKAMQAAMVEMPAITWLAIMDDYDRMESLITVRDRKIAELEKQIVALTSHRGSYFE